MSNTPLELVLNRLPDAKRNGNQWSARCPSHEDRKPSLSISRGEDGCVLLHCHAGCTPEAICHALGIGLRDLMPPDNGRPTSPRIVATYDYEDENGELLFQVCRFTPKDFRQRRPDGKGGWVWNIKGVQQVPFNLPAITQNPNKVVFVAEGEKDVLALAEINVLATCNAGGAGKWRKSHAGSLKDREVVVLSDNDEVGRKHARQVALSLQGVAKSVKVVELQGLPEKGDASDWLATGGTEPKLLKLVDESPIWTPEDVQPEPWSEFNPLDNRELPAFPTEALPPVLREFVEAESRATQTPPDLAGMLSLAVCSATIARRVEVIPRGGWVEPTNLFAAVLLAPGNRKSAVYNDSVAPLRQYEDAIIEARRDQVSVELSERRQAVKRLEKLEKRIADKGNANDRAEARELAMQLSDWQVASLPEVIVDDVTSEQLAVLLSQQGGRIASMSPEGDVFDRMAGLYNKSGIPQFGVYLMGHSGDDLKVDRVTRDPIYVKRPALTCAYTIQPQVIEGLAKNVAFRGRGLLARFLYAFPRSPIGAREIAPDPVPDRITEAYRGLVLWLAEHATEGQLGLSDDAAREFIQWETDIENMLADGGEMEAIRDWGAKLAGATLRIAAVIHCVEHAGRNTLPVAICRPTIHQAVTIARYLIPHAEAVLRMMTCTELAAHADAAYLARWIERERLEEFTKRDAHRHGQRRFSTADDIDPALDTLTRRGYIRPLPNTDSRSGRPSSTRYQVRPDVLDCGSLESGDRSDQTPSRDLQSRNSVTSVSAFGESENKTAQSADDSAIRAPGCQNSQNADEWGEI